MTIKKDILTVNVTPNGMREVRGLVLHSMWGTYAGSISWFKNPQSQASCHYLISRYGEITQMAEHSTMTWHAGVYDSGKCPAWASPNPNFYTIGIELEDERNANWPYPDKQRQALRELVTQLQQLYRIPRDRILLHKDLNPSRRSDPVGAFSFDWLFPATPTPPAQPSELEQARKDRDINWNMVVSICTALGVEVKSEDKDGTVKRAKIVISELYKQAANNDAEKYRHRLEQFKQLANQPI